MEVLTHALHEFLLDNVVATFDLDMIGQFLIDLIFIFSLHEVRDFTSIENVVNVLKERLSENLRVSHCECNFFAFDSRFEHKLLDEFIEVFIFVILLDLNLFKLEFIHEGREAHK